MRLSVRLVCSPLTASKPSPMAISGTRKARNETNDGNGYWSRVVVNSRRNKNGSSAVLSLSCWIAPYTAASAVSTTSHSRTRMRALVRWSDSSLRKTTPRPRQGEPSRRMTDPMAFEITGIDHLEARLLDRKPRQASAGGDHSSRSLGPHVVVGQQAKPISAGHLHRLHA